MNIIVPAGRKPEWVPSDDEKLMKTASTGEASEVQEVDEVYEAAKGFLEAQEAEAQIKEAGEDKSECKCKDECKCEDECKCKDECKCSSDDKEVKEAGFGCADEEVVELEVTEPESVEEVSDESEEEAAGSVADAVREVEDKAAEAEEKVEQVLEAVEGIGEAVDAAKDACSEIAGTDVEDIVEVEIEVEDEGSDDEGEEGLIVESEPEDEDLEACAGKEAAMDKSASAEEFCRYSMISGPNRKKLADYWVNALGYPKDYVKLMVKDYE